MKSDMLEKRSDEKGLISFKDAVEKGINCFKLSYSDRVKLEIMLLD
ncbi:hypothetical protein HYQ41_08450 [Facklamia sp. DSM 111019]|nr:hypothetical protein [Facklamia lactis]